MMKIPAEPNLPVLCANRSGKRKALIPLTAILALAVAVWSERADSLPRLSAEQGLACVDCHFAPGGGAQRNEFGHFTVSVNELTLQSTKKKLMESYKSPRLSDAVLAGSDVRFRLMEDGSAERYQTDLYLSVEPFYRTYFNVTFSGGVIDESYVLITNTQNSLFAQAGRFYPGYGLRLDDFTFFVKNKTGVFHRLALEGATVGAYYLGHTAYASYFSSGEQSVWIANITRSGFAGEVTYIYGISGRIAERRENGSRGAFPTLKGAYAGIGWRGHSVLFEGDLIGDANDAYAIYWGASARIIPGLFIRGDYNFYDPDRRLQSGAEEFVRASVELWPMPFVELNPGVTFYTNGPLDGESEFEFRLHLAY